MLDWTTVDSDGSLFSRGKHDYYAIVVRGIPQEHPEDCIVELYVTDKEMTINEIKTCAYREKITLLSTVTRFGGLVADGKYRSGR